MAFGRHHRHHNRPYRHHPLPAGYHGGYAGGFYGELQGNEMRAANSPELGADPIPPTVQPGATATAGGHVVLSPDAVEVGKWVGLGAVAGLAAKAAGLAVLPAAVVGVGVVTLGSFLAKDFGA